MLCCYSTHRNSFPILSHFPRIILSWATLLAHKAPLGLNEDARWIFDNRQAGNGYPVPRVRQAQVSNV